MLNLILMTEEHNTFEYHLGVVENNLTNPEKIKTKKTFTHSAISLFTKKPSSKEYGDNYMREQFGIPDKRYKNKCFRIYMQIDILKFMESIKLNLEKTKKTIF